MDIVNFWQNEKNVLLVRVCSRKYLRRISHLLHTSAQMIKAVISKNWPSRLLAETSCKPNKLWENHMKLFIVQQDFNIKEALYCSCKKALNWSDNFELDQYVSKNVKCARNLRRVNVLLMCQTCYSTVSLRLRP